MLNNLAPQPQWHLVQPAKPVYITNPKEPKKGKTKHKVWSILPDPQIGYRHIGDNWLPFHDEKAMDVALQITNWLYYNDSDVNSRLWQDFGARSARVLNVPFLNLCYNRIVELNKKTYKVEVIGGLTDLASRLGGWNRLGGDVATIAQDGDVIAKGEEFFHPVRDVDKRQAPGFQRADEAKKLGGFRCR